MTELRQDQAILLFDGVCGFCNRLVNFLIARDKNDRLRFMALQTDLAQEILRRHNFDSESLQSAVLIRHFNTPKETLALRSRAALGAVAVAGGFFGILAQCALIVPAFLLDPIYNFIAKLRYRLFGKLDQCRLPTEADRSRFLA